MLKLEKRLAFDFTKYFSCEINKPPSMKKRKEIEIEI